MRYAVQHISNDIQFYVDYVIFMKSYKNIIFKSSCNFLVIVCLTG